MYREERTIEAATYLLAQSSEIGEAVPYIKLIKLLYLADREHILTFGSTITGDDHWSLPYGPILSHTLSAIKSSDKNWMPFVGVDLDAKVIWLKEQAKPAQLSRADRSSLDKVSRDFGHMGWEELVEYTHGLSEWKKPVGNTKRTRIYLGDIARGLGLSEERIAAILALDQERNEIHPFIESLRSISSWLR
jgi:uncharacterized phage-associated protein